jgi:hypothetical protein
MAIYLNIKVYVREQKLLVTARDYFVGWRVLCKLHSYSHIVEIFHAFLNTMVYRRVHGSA